MEWMKKHRYQLLGGAVVLLLLAAAFFLDEKNANPPAVSQTELQTEAISQQEDKGTASNAEGVSTTSEAEKSEMDDTVSTTAVIGNSETGTATEQSTAEEEENCETSDSDSMGVADNAVTTTETTTEATTETATVTCTISISCATILDNMDALNAAKVTLVPADGMILSSAVVTVEEGQSVYDALRKVCQQAGIPLDAAGTTAYGTAYVKGINNIYEFDCGNLSGWKYCVNGSYPNYGCSSYVVTDGDVIQWNYSCTMNDL